MIPKVRAVLHNALRPQDRFELVVSGGGVINHFSQMQPADSATIDTVLQDFQQSSLDSTLSLTRKPVIVYCDGNSQTIWRFPTLDSVATIESFDDILSAAGSFPTADIIASYEPWI